jgi:hypothetical protein
MGDLHSTLHVGYGEDKGGNANANQLQFKRNKSSTFFLWIPGIIEYKKIVLADCLGINKAQNEN